MAKDGIQEDRDAPLTLSQLSPRKLLVGARTNSPVPQASVVDCSSNMSDMRPTSKRPMADESNSEGPKLKKSKGDDSKTDKRGVITSHSNQLANSKPRLPLTSMQKQKPRSYTKPRFPSNSRIRSVSSSSTVLGPSGKAIRKRKDRAISAGKLPAFDPGTGWNDDVRVADEKNTMRLGSSSTSSLNLFVSNPLNRGDKKNKQLNTSDSLEKLSAPSSKLNTSMKAEQQEAKEMEMERGPSESRSVSRSRVQLEKHRFYHPPPNFKAIHAALDVSIAQRKENIHPTVPLSMQWETDLRMQERRKFDAKVKEREREKEKEEEMRRILCEAEEEREIKELRKRLVVKAHEVPEWYSKMPKSKKKEPAEVTEK